MELDLKVLQTREMMLIMLFMFISTLMKKRLKQGHDVNHVKFWGGNAQPNPPHPNISPRS